jgi:hypothetical protein
MAEKTSQPNSEGEGRMNACVHRRTKETNGVKAFDSILNACRGRVMAERSDSL